MMFPRARLIKWCDSSSATRGLKTTRTTTGSAIRLTNQRSGSIIFCFVQAITWTKRIDYILFRSSDHLRTKRAWIPETVAGDVVRVVADVKTQAGRASRGQEPRKHDPKPASQE